MKSWDYMDADPAAGERLRAGRAGSIESYFSADRQAQQQLSLWYRHLVHEGLRLKCLRIQKA